MGGDRLPAIPIDDATQQDRLLALEKISAPKLEVSIVEQAIRLECHGPWIDKAIAVWDTGAFDASYLYFWNRAMADLRTKVMAYGKEHLEAIIKHSINDERDLINLLDDKALIDHCFELGIISEQAWFFLHKAREVRNHYSLAHQFDAQIDPLEAINIIKNCIKYVLSYQVPAPGINLKNLLEKLKKEDVSPNISEFEATYREQASKIVNITLNRLFDDFVAEKSNNTYINNILLLAPILWALADSNVKTRIGKAVARHRTEGDAATSAQTLEFVKKVDGLKYVPESIRVAIFTSAAEKFYEACQGMNNFHYEPGAARELRELGTEIPSSAIHDCTKAVFLSYIGNQYGHSWGASDHNLEMIQAWGTSNVSALMDILDNDLTTIGRLDSRCPALKFKEILEVIDSITVDGETSKKLELYQKLDAEEIKRHFLNKYTSKFRKG